MSIETDFFEEENKEKPSGVSVTRIVLILMVLCTFCGLAYWKSHDAIFVKNYNFLENYEHVTGNLLDVYKVSGYSRDCVSRYENMYRTAKLMKVSYKVNNNEYVTDVNVSYLFSRYCKVGSELPDTNVWRIDDYYLENFPKYDHPTVRLLYNIDDPSDVRLEDDMMIKHMLEFNSDDRFVEFALMDCIMAGVAIFVGILVSIGVYVIVPLFSSGKKPSKKIKRQQQNKIQNYY